MLNKRGDYCEEVVKNTKEREDYREDVNAFVKTARAAAGKARRQYMDPQKYLKNGEKYRKDLFAMLGYPLNGPAGEAKLVSKTHVTRDRNVDIYRMVLNIGGIRFYGLYFEQIESPEKAPFVLSFHGGAGTPELISGIHWESTNYNYFVRRVTDRGANVFAPQLLLWNPQEYGNPTNRGEVDTRLRQLGGTITALELWLTRAAVDYLVAHEKVNPDRMGCAGLSYGGMYAYFMAAVDTRMKASYSSSWVADTFVYAWGDWCYWNAETTLSTAEVGGLVSPRALVVSMGRQDELFDWHLTEKTCGEILPYYEAAGCPEKFKVCFFEGPHEFDKSDEEIDFLMEHI